MATKRFSLFLGINEPKTQPTIEEQELCIEEKKSRRFSLPSGSLSEGETATIDKRFEIIVSRDREVRRKRSRRFSLFGIAALEDDNEFFPAGEEKPITSVRERGNIATMVFKLFHVRTSRQGTKHQRNNTARSAVFFTPQGQAGKTKNQNHNKIMVKFVIKPFRKPSKEAPIGEKDVDRLSLTPTVVQESKDAEKRARKNSLCDSKFSWNTSVVSFTSLPHEIITITAEQCTILLHLARKLGISLHKQKRVTSNFSTNLAHLFARKEKIIDGNKRLSRDLRKMLMSMMAGLRELVGRTFLKKSVFLERSLGLVHDMTEMLDYDPPGIEMKAMEINDSDTTLVSSQVAEVERRRPVPVEERNPSVMSIPRPEAEHQLSVQLFLHNLTTLREDIGLQQQLDAALRGGIVGPCEDLRFPASANERIALRRFVDFVDGCLGRVEKCYAQEACVVNALEILGGVLKDEVMW